MNYKDYHFIYLKIEFLGRLTVQKRGKLVEPEVAVNADSIALSQPTSMVVPSTHKPQYAIQQLLHAIDDSPISDDYKNSLRRYALKGLLEHKSSSPKKLLELGQLFVENNPDTTVKSTHITLLRQTLLAMLDNNLVSSLAPNTQNRRLQQL